MITVSGIHRWRSYLPGQHDHRSTWDNCERDHFSTFLKNVRATHDDAAVHCSICRLSACRANALSDSERLVVYSTQPFNEWQHRRATIAAAAAAAAASTLCIECDRVCVHMLRPATSCRRVCLGAISPRMRSSAVQRRPATAPKYWPHTHTDSNREQAFRDRLQPTDIPVFKINTVSVTINEIWNHFSYSFCIVSYWVSAGRSSVGMCRMSDRWWHVHGWSL